MRKVLLLTAALATGLTVAGCQPGEVAEQANASQSVQEMPHDTVVLRQAKERQERIEGGPYMTVIGPGLTFGAFESVADSQRPVLQEDFERVAETRDDRLFLTLPFGTDTARMSMDTFSRDEGNLFRVHVAMLPPEESEGMVAIVMGFYDAMWSEKAVGLQALPCIRCGRVWVCGSNPSCSGGS